MKLIAETTAKVRFTNRWRGSTGSAARRSTSAQTTVRTTPRTPSPIDPFLGTQSSALANPLFLSALLAALSRLLFHMRPNLFDRCLSLWDRLFSVPPLLFRNHLYLSHRLDPIPRTAALVRLDRNACHYFRRHSLLHPSHASEKSRRDLRAPKSHQKRLGLLEKISKRIVFLL